MKRETVLKCASFLILAAALPAHAADSDTPTETVVVTAALLGGVPSDELGSSATVLDAEALEERQTDIVSDVLRDVPGVAVNRSGPIGHFTQIRIRGAEANHTLVLIDGIKASDPFYGEFDFATLIADDVAKVEVLRGEQSALYGSDAIGGVVQYITATGADAPGFRIRFEGGSFGTAEATARVAGVSDGLDYAVSAAYYTTQGVPDNNFGTRDLGSQNLALAGKFSYAVNEDLHLNAVVRYSATDADVNEQDFNFPPDATDGFEIDGNGSYKNRATYGLFGAEYDALDGRWQNAVNFQGVLATRNGYGNNGFDAGERSSGDNGERAKATYVSSLDFGDSTFAQKLTASFDWEREYYRNTDPTGEADTSQRHGDNFGFVSEYGIVIDNRLSLSVAGRYDKNYNFADAFTYHLQASYRFDGGFRLHAAAGSGIKNPTIYELYGFSPGPDSFIGNPNLKPELSNGWEAGVEQTVFDGMLVANLTYFNSTLEDEIFTTFVGPDFAASPQNATTVSTREGVEASLSANIGKEWRIDAAYTYLHAIQDGQEEVRRAPHIASLNIAWRAPDDVYGANLTVRYNGAQTDDNFTLSGPPVVTLPAYTLVNIGADYRLSPMFQLYGRVENLLDSKYQEVYTINGIGRAFFLGIRAST